MAEKVIYIIGNKEQALAALPEEIRNNLEDVVIKHIPEIRFDETWGHDLPEGIDSKEGIVIMTPAMLTSYGGLKYNAGYRMGIEQGRTH